MRFHRRGLYIFAASLLGLGSVAFAQNSTVLIPGPLRSFLRMAGVSQKAAPEDILPLFARSVFIRGYSGGRPSEYLMLLDRYVAQARELQALAGPSGALKVTSCTDAVPLLQILGYRIRNGCGKTTLLMTADPDRAFLTIDSGFPLPQLEEALQNGQTFTMPYTYSQVPGLLHEGDWFSISTSRRRGISSLIDAIVDDPSVARLYWAMSKLDPETRNVLLRQPGLRRLAPVAAVLDFYGGELTVRDNRVIVPGGPTSDNAWKDIVGASPQSPGDFILHLLAKDRGWTAAYFDAMSRASREEQAHLTEPTRIKQLYEAFRPYDQDPPATRGVFRRAPDILVLFSRANWAPDGSPHIPGDIDTWKHILADSPRNHAISEWAKHAKGWNRPEQVLQGMVGISRTDMESGPLQVFLQTNAIDRARGNAAPLDPQTVRLMASHFSQYANWFPLFAEFPELDNQSIQQFINTAQAVGGISNETLRGNALGSFQSVVGIWQVLARQDEIQPAMLNASWQHMLEPFNKVQNDTELFDHARESLGQLATAAAGKPNCTQDEWINLLGGPSQSSREARAMQQEMAGRIRSVMIDQRLVSLDTLFAFSDGLSALSQGTINADKLIPMAEELREFEMPRAILTTMERIEWAPRGYSIRHAQLQARVDMTKLLKSQPNKQQLENARGTLAAFLRDTLVGLNYAYYEPPGAQMLHHNPVFVRAHDFTGTTVSSPERAWMIAELFGTGSPASGGAYLAGSLADLPFALAKSEQDFIVPENVQALIWRELVPELLVSASLPRWWEITAPEMHAAALYQRAGEDLIDLARKNPETRSRVRSILEDRLTVGQMIAVDDAWNSKSSTPPKIAPADAFYLASLYRTHFPQEEPWSPAAQELANLSKEHPEDTKADRIARDFGVAHPVMDSSYGRDLLAIKPFPFFGGFSSRLFGESWDSNNFYWARLADELGYQPVMLHRLVPELTRRMTAKIFASHIEDWAALDRAMRETGEDFRHSIAAQKAAQAVASSVQ